MKPSILILFTTLINFSCKKDALKPPVFPAYTYHSVQDWESPSGNFYIIRFIPTELGAYYGPMVWSPSNDSLINSHYVSVVIQIEGTPDFQKIPYVFINRIRPDSPGIFYTVKTETVRRFDQFEQPRVIIYAVKSASWLFSRKVSITYNYHH